MGQTPSKKIIKPWADGPFPLLETPRKRLGTKAGDPKSESGPIQAASTMAIVHNVVIRGLNCIYLQALNVKTEQDITDFLQYITSWDGLLHEHHTNEEEHFFPWLEEDIGIEKYMDANVEQHHAFELGLKRFKEYVSAVKAGKEQFSGAKVREHIDGFGGILTGHLRDEITFFEDLAKFGDKINWPKWEKRVEKHAVSHANLTSDMAFVLTNHDMTYEGRIHDPVWPPLPWIALVFLRIFVIPKLKGAWRFSCCDSHGQPKELELS